jgi:hypothetical protein
MSAGLHTHTRTDAAPPARTSRPTRHRWLAVAAGLLLVAWIVVQLLIIRTLSLFHPAYLAIGLAFAWAGRRLERREG